MNVSPSSYSGGLVRHGMATYTNELDQYLASEGAHLPPAPAAPRLPFALSVFVLCVYLCVSKVRTLLWRLAAKMASVCSAIRTTLLQVTS